MKTFNEFFTLGVNKPTMAQIQGYLDHLGTRLMSVKDIIKHIEKYYKTIKNLKLDRYGRKVLSFEEFQIEDIKVPIKVGDTVLGGKFKNKKMVVKDIGKNEKGDLTINGRPLLKFRIFSEENLQEKLVAGPIAWQQSLSTYIFDVGSDIDAVKIPVHSAIIKRLWPEDVRATVFHVTDAGDFKNLVRLQGKKKSISAFTEMRGNYFSTGVQTGGGVVVELDANVLMAAGMDIMSAPDKSGRRWIEVRYLRGKFYEKDLNAIEKDIKQMLIGILADVQEAGYIRSAPQRGSNINNKKMAIHWRNLGYQIKDDGRALKEVIGDYMDGMEKVIKKNSTRFKSIFRDYIKKRYTDESWDEIIVNQILIKKVHVVESSHWEIEPIMGFMKEVNKLGVPVKMADSNQKLEDYIRKIARDETSKGKEDDIERDIAFKEKEVKALFQTGSNRALEKAQEELTNLKKMRDMMKEIEEEEPKIEALRREGKHEEAAELYQKVADMKQNLIVFSTFIGK